MANQPASGTVPFRHPGRAVSLRRSLAAAWPQILALFVFVLVLWAQPGQSMVGAFFDDGIYVTLAKALADGDGYRNVHLPGAPPAVHFPFLYPAALAVLWRLWPVFPDNVTLFQLFDAAALAAAAWVIAAHARRWGPPPAAQYVALPLAFAAFPLLTYVGMRFAEPLYLLLWAGAVAVADRDTVGNRGALTAGALAGLAALARGVGIVVMGGVVLALAIRGRRRHSLLAAVAGVLTAAPWFVWTAVHGPGLDSRIAANYGSYANAARQSGLAGFLPDEYLGGFGPLAQLLLPVAPPWLWQPGAILVVGLVVWGGVAAARRAPALVASLTAYLLLVSSWFWFPDRFVWIVSPWLLLLGVAGVGAAWRRVPALRPVVAVLAIACAVGYSRREAISLAQRGFAAPARKVSAPFTLLAPAIEAETPRDAVIATDREALVWLYTGRRAVPSYLFRWSGRGAGTALSDDETTRYYCDVGVTHVALAGPGAPAAPMIIALAERADSTLRPVFHFTHGPRLYRFRCPN